MIIGVTGGVGTGKSAVLDILKNRFNAAIIMTDDVAKELMKPGGLSYESVCGYFGEEILTAGPGSPIDRAVLSKIVFNDKKKLEKLNSLTHPLVKQRVGELAEHYIKSGYDIIVIETAILIESGYLDMTDELWVIYADMEIRAKRLQETRGYSQEKIRSIINNQMSFDDLKKYADFIIDNSGSLQDTETQIRNYFLHAGNKNK
ncbi:MAG: dephospho-CoA kinase [Parasporobacterium sp.]|nr:dephospho-CoA kinase [Parasporobacterium sp.]